MGKKVKKKSRASAKEKGVATHSPRKVMESCNLTAESVGEGVLVAKETNSCPHIVKGVNLNRLSSMIGSSGSIRCEDCREGAADRRSSKGKGKHGKKKGGASLDSKSESKSLWVCLECGQYTCGGVGLPITPRCHVVGHARKNGHPLVVHFDKPQLCWCFPCNMLIQVDKIEKTDETSHLSDVVKLLKGRSLEKSSVDIEDVSLGGGIVNSEIKSEDLLTNDSYGQGGYVVRGMVNLGNTCFFNSIMQNLLAMNRLRDSFLKLDAPVGPLINSLKKLFTETNPDSGLKNVINPRSFFGCVCSKSPQFRGYQQHDSHELLRCLLDGLSTEELTGRKQNGSPKIDGISSNTLVDTLFGGQISSTVCCIECGHFSTVYEPFLDLSLPVPTKKPPPRKAQQVSRTKKAKLPPKKVGKTRVKVNRDTDPLPVQNVSNQLSSHESSRPDLSIISVSGGMGTSPGDSTVLGSEERSSVADKDDLSSPNLVTAGESQHMQVLDSGAGKPSASDNFTWLDFVEAGTMVDECDFISQKEDAPEIQDTESKDKCLNEFPAQASCESSGSVCFLKEDQDQRPDSSANGWEDEIPLQVQGSEVLLLPYKEESSSAGEIVGKDGEGSSSVLGGGQEELEFDGFGDLFNEPEVVVGPSPRPSSCSEVTEAGFVIGSNSESDPDEVDDTDSPVSVESCLAHFIKPELLSDENAWHCENCSKVLQRQKMEEKTQTRTVSDGNGRGSHDEPWHAPNSCPFKTKSIRNEDIKNDKNIETSVSHVKHGRELENGQRDNLSLINERDHGAFEMEDKHNDELQSSGFHEACNEERCNLSAADSCITENVQRRDSLVLGSDNNDLEETDSRSVKVKRDATKRVLIYKAPPVLTIHLKRFSQDARGRLSKLNGHVNFREVMDIRTYIDPRCMNEDTYEYHLVGVVEHSGTMRGGHYVAYVRGGQRNRGKGDRVNECSTWYQASDAYVREVSLDEVLRCEAYILFYEKNLNGSSTF
ncbi:ubiquitin carboxyl-terminal hydrolase 2 [Abrus precatorius]|uniref:Ubiquitin carboxyl-terminal hydrolase n=1 Tax=Abrus precatorius TaxID=3816 RepID=A0A8B8JT82_ABRPR|nr:ubiquitin carboxyl-terminal hydrolase 2 [Abrus precatorius]XP_027334713.1 ubiquitin carboxyl-terminal hydrolase 2 [Abrus precatorius]XP_027334714.1 ubiquitin carboxyl-terminal hydrolase 2 [Abrus precatorius]